MSKQISADLKATGVAQVLVVLQAPTATASASTARSTGGITLARSASRAPEMAGLENYFTNSELSINSALARAGMSNVAAGGTLRSVSSPRRAVPQPPAVLHYPNLGLMLGTVNREGLAGLRADARVAKVTGAPQPRLIKPVRVAAAKLTSKTTWGIEFLDVPKLWGQGLTGKGVRVAHLDTGADGRHPALKAAIADFAEFDSFGFAVNPAPSPHDTGDHGTHTAATIAGRAAQGRSVGVAPGADLFSAIVIEGGNVIARILGGMDWAVTQGVRVLSMSLGLPFTPPMEEFNTILQILRARNILPVIAVGNEGPGTSRTPGNHPEPISVGAIDNGGLVADFSCSQRFVRPSDPLVPDLVAPGVDIISAMPGGGHQSMDGTSMATPHVAGLAALLFEAAPSSTISEVENAIYNSCQLASGVPPERGNRGCPNAARALAALTGVVVGAPIKGPAKKAAKKPAKKAAKKSAKKAYSKKGGGSSAGTGAKKAAGKGSSKKGSKTSSKKR